jgi:NAD(P)-dependent dehydrogenase (short-subunit alcohol dehydrogenase family)
MGVVSRGRCDLSGEVALVTGALGRLGLVWTEALLDAGARVIGLDLPEAKVGDAFAAVLDAPAGQVRLVRGDVTDRTSLVQARTECAELGWTPSVLVNNAGIDQPPAVLRTYAVEDIPPAVFRGALDVNVLGAFQVMQVFGPAMVAARGGSIINIGSLYATVAPDPRLYDHLPNDPPFLKPPAYGASKAALLNLTRYFAVLWGRHGVRVNALSPGGVRGDQDEAFQTKYAARVPLGRMAAPEDLGGPLVFLASEASRYVSGINLQVDGGFTAW